MVVFVCETVNPAQIFNQIPCPLEQPVLLSLIQQLSADIGNNTELKHKYVVFIHTQQYWTQTQVCSMYTHNHTELKHKYVVFIHTQPYWTQTQVCSIYTHNHTELKHKYVVFIHTQPYWTQTQVCIIYTYTTILNSNTSM